MIKFPADDIVGSGYLAIPRSGHGPGILVLHAWWGLNGFFRGLCDKLASEGFVAFAPDLHHGRVASTVDEAKGLMERIESKVAKKEVMGAVDFLKNHQATGKKKMGMIGFSMGGAWALWLSNQRPDVDAVVVFYGTEGGDFTNTHAAFLGHYAPGDEWEPDEGVKALENTIRSAGREVTFHHYPGSKHWFFEQDRPDAYDPEAAKLAWERTLLFLRTRLV